MTNDKEWREYRMLIIDRLERNQDDLERIKDSMGRMKGDIKVLYVKVGIIALIAGAIPAGVVLLLRML